MSTVAAGIAVAVSVLCSAVIAGWSRRYALRTGMMDRPNARSSHLTPTPRGGGLAIVATVLAGIVYASLWGWIRPNLAIALGGGGIAVAGIGWLDDVRGTRPLLRAIVHVTAATWLVAWLGGLPEIRMGDSALPLGWMGSVVAVIGTTWMINLYNFMDGVDGLAASQAVVATAGAAVILAAGGAHGLALISWILMGASAGFIYWNLPPARLFMGDVGSGFIGFLFAALALSAERVSLPGLLVGLLLLYPFVFDATLTLIRRGLAGEVWYEAHRSHAYQRLIRAGATHGQVTAGVALLDVTFALAAWIAWRETQLLALALLAATALLAVGYLLVERMEPMLKPNLDVGEGPPAI